MKKKEGWLQPCVVMLTFALRKIFGLNAGVIGFFHERHLIMVV